MSSRFAMAAARPARSMFALSTRGFQTSAFRAGGLKESSEDPESEKHKQDSLDKQRKGQGQWKPELASDSEEAIKADRDNTTPQELADKTKGAAGKGAKA